MLCTVCGTLNDDSSQICSRCGSNMTFHTQEHYEYHQVYNQQPNYSQQNYQQPNYQQPNYQQNPYYPQPERKDPGKVLGIVGFALSMASFVLSDGILLAIAGIIVSAIGFKKSKEAGFNNGFAKAGLISGIIITALLLLLIVFFIIIYVIMFLYTMGPSAL